MTKITTSEKPKRESNNPLHFFNTHSFHFILSVLLISGSFLFFGVGQAQAALFAPGTTLDPGCAPTDSNCGIATSTASVSTGTAGQVAYYATGGNVLSGIATSSLGLLTTNVAEGANLYFTNARAIAALTGQNVSIFYNDAGYLNVAAFQNAFDARFSATTTLPNITTLSSLSGVSTTLTGILRATAGTLSTSLINLASDVTGILPVSNGGTGVSAIASGFIPFGNGGGAIATSSNLVWNATNSSLGIGTTSPYALLSLNGTPGGTSNLFAIATSTSGYATSTALRVDSNGNLYLPGGNGINIGYGTTTPPANGMIVMGNVGIGTTTPLSSLSIQGVSGFSVLNVASTTGASELYVASNGNVGIGTTTPGAALVVNGNMLIAGTVQFNSGVTIGNTEQLPAGIPITATAYPGSDIGAQVSAACIANPGATIQIPSGAFSFSTSMDVTGCHVQGMGESTKLTYTGTGNAIYTQIGVFSSSAVTFTNTTSTISATGIGTAFNRAGWVLTVTGSVSNNRSFTVVSVTDANDIVVTPAPTSESDSNTIYFNTVLTGGELSDFVLIARALATATPVALNNVNNFHVDNVTVTNGPSGYPALSILGTGNKTNPSDTAGASFQGAYLKNVNISNNGGDGVYIGGQGNGVVAVVEESQIYGNGGIGVHAKYGTGVTGSGMNQVGNVDVSDSYIVSNCGGDIVYDVVVGGHIGGNSLNTGTGSCSAAPISIDPNTSGLRSVGVTIDAGNIISPAAYPYGIQINHSNDVSVKDNDFLGTCLNAGNATVAVLGASEAIDLLVPDCRQIYVANGTTAISCKDYLGASFGFGWNGTTPQPVHYGSGTQFPMSEFTSWSGGYFANQYPATDEPDANTTVSTGGSFLQNHTYNIYMVYKDAAGHRAPISAPYNWTAPSGTNTNTITIFFNTITFPPYAAAVEFYCQDVTSGANPTIPVLCGSQASMSPTHLTLTSPTSPGTLYPGATGFSSKFGGSNSYTLGSFASGFTSFYGASVSSASTIVPTGNAFPLTGTTGVSLIAIPISGWTGQITMIPTGVVTFSTGGSQSGLNYSIGATYTSTSSVPITATFDGTYWWLK